MYNFSGKSILITGATGMLGKHLTCSLGRAGGHIFVHGRDPKLVSDLCILLHKENIKHTPVVFDLCDVSMMQFEISSLTAKHKIDILINNAGERVASTDFLKLAPTELTNVIQTNLVGTMCLTQEVLKHMRACNSGQILTITSLVAKKSFPQYHGVHYISSKAALESMNLALREEFQETNIRFNTVAPGPIIDNDQIRASKISDAVSHNQIVEDIIAALSVDSASNIEITDL